MRFSSLLLCFSVITTSIYSEDTKEETSCCPQKEELCKTTHKTLINNAPLSYEAVVGSILLKDDKCQPTANMFFTSYSKVSDTPEKNRPITFCFNGGPGSSSVWLHLGLAGPKRVLMQSNDKTPPPPYELVDNEFSLLDLTDLVFIDPISTGFSEAIPVDNAKNFHTTKEDIASIGEFIRSYLTKFNKWDSAKYIMGESYGTLRAAGLASYLHEEELIDVNGLILISSVLSYQSVVPHLGNDLPYLLLLPSYTATAWQYNKLPPELQKDFQAALKESKEFLFSDYITALFKGDQLSTEEKNQTAEKLSRITGLSQEYILKNNLRVPVRQFTKEFLAKENLLIGRFDSQVTGPALDPTTSYATYDPSFDNIASAFTTSLNNYLRNNLKWKGNAPYAIFCDAARHWDFNAPNRYLNLTDDFRKTITKNPHLKVFVASGYYDLATPYFGAEYAFDHLELPSSVNDRIEIRNYEGGHMMYLNLDTLKLLKQDLTSFYKSPSASSL